MERSEAIKLNDFFLQILLILALFLVITLFVMTRLNLWQKPYGENMYDLFKDDPYKIELELNQKKSDLHIYQTELAKKYADFRAELKQIDQLNLDELEKKARKNIVIHTYPESVFDNLKTKINRTLEEIKSLESLQCNLRCRL